MSTFASIMKIILPALTTMAPGVAAALVATVTGLLVAIPAMFAYNFMVTISAPSRRSWMASLSATPRKLNTSMWTAVRWPKKLNSRMKRWPGSSWMD